MELRHFTIKNQLNTKRDSNISDEEQNSVEYIKNKQQNYRSPLLSVINLNVDGLNSPIKRQSSTE